MLYGRYVCITEISIRSRRAMTTGELASLLPVSSRTIHSDSDVIDEWLEGFSHEPMVRIPGIGILLKGVNGQIQIHLREKGTGGYVISSVERVRSIAGQLLSEGSPASTAEVAEELQMSAVTVSNDLQKVKAWMDRSCIHIVPEPYMGVTVRDTESNIRRGYIMVLREMLETGTYQRELIGMGFTQVKSLL